MCREQHTYFSIKATHCVTSVCSAPASGEVGLRHLVRRIVLSGIWTRSVLAERV